jgi:hypothetical protein
VQFVPGQRKDDVTQQYLADFTADEGIMFVGPGHSALDIHRGVIL